MYSLSYIKKLHLLIELTYSQEEDLVEQSSVIEGEMVVVEDDIFCDIVWQDIMFGDGIGQGNSLIPFDFDNDGTMELIVNANADTYRTIGFWYILKYSPILQSYEKVYISNYYNTEITKMILADINSDGINELLLSVENYIFIIDLTTYETIQTIHINEIPFPYHYVQIVVADIDADNQIEILVSTFFELVVINTTNFEVDNVYDVDGGNFDIGNVDDDENLEVVFANGATFEIDSNGILTEEYDFRDTETFENNVRLTDLNMDGILEAVVMTSWEGVKIYDVQNDELISEIEFEFSTNLSSLNTIDIDDDGIDEIVVGERQWGSVMCFDAITSEQIWEIENPSHGVTSVAIDDFDNDGEDEVVWGTGVSSVERRMYVYSTSQLGQTLEWQNTDRVGPYSAVCIGDIDNDNTLEIITLNRESNNGEDYGLFSIFNAETKEIEYRSDVIYIDDIWFPNELDNMEIIDFGNDGDNDIMMASGSGGGEIWVIDGDSLYVEEHHFYPYDLIGGRFRLLEYVDIDNDGDMEFLTASSELFVIDAESFEIEWTSEEYDGSSKDLFMGDVDSDNLNEIIFCKGKIHKFESPSYLHSETESSYLAMKLYDWDNDGNLEIIGGSEDGEIHIIDGSTLEVIESFPLFEQTVGDAFLGLEIADFENDNNPEVIFTSEDNLYIMDSDGNLLISQAFTSHLGQYDALKINDYDNDGELDIFLGTAYRVVELNASCMQNIVTSISNENNEIEDILTIYPNPAKDQINISYKGKEPIQEIRLFSIDGKLIIEETASDFNYHTIILPEVAPGSYVLRLKIDEQYVFKKVLLE